MRCLVSGATGHLGSFLVRRLVRAGQEVAILARESSSFWQLEDVIGRLRLIRWDLTAPARATEEIAEYGAETVFHLAWSGITAEERELPEQITVNVPATLALWEAARRGGCRCWVGVGSQAEYGPYDCPLSVDLPPRPNSAYGAAKLSAGLLTEHLCRLSGIRFIWFRLLATYGPTDDERHLIPFVITHLLEGRTPALSDGTAVWDYLYVEDAAEVMYKAAASPVANGFYVLGSGCGHTIREIAEGVRDLIDPALPLGFGLMPRSSAAPRRLVADISRICADTSWRPRTSLADGLQQTIEWHRERLK